MSAVSRTIVAICFSKPASPYYFKSSWLDASPRLFYLLHFSSSWPSSLKTSQFWIQSGGSDGAWFRPCQSERMSSCPPWNSSPHKKKQSWQSKGWNTRSNSVWLSESLNFPGRAAKFKSGLVQGRKLWEWRHRPSNFTLKVKVNLL